MSGTNESRNNSHDLYSTLRAEFCLASDGSIRDRSRRGWMIWNVSHFQLWWNALETTANVPLGRKLMNCSADRSMSRQTSRFSEASVMFANPPTHSRILC